VKLVDFAALALENDAEIIFFDTDFTRFERVRSSLPPAA